MKILTAILCAAILVGLTASATADQVKHVVSFKFKTKATPEEIKKVETTFKDLKNKIPEIQSLEWGTNISPEPWHKDFTHCWILTFNSTKDRDAYLVHPRHKAFGKAAGPIIQDLFVIDFIVQK